MEIRFVRSWRRHVIGSLWAPGDGVANVLIKRNLAVAVVGGVSSDASLRRGRPRKKG